MFGEVVGFAERAEVVVGGVAAVGVVGGVVGVAVVGGCVAGEEVLPGAEDADEGGVEGADVGGMVKPRRDRSAGLRR